MEQRHGRRRLIDIHTVIRYEALGLISGKVRDIGPGGLSLRAGPVTLPPHVPVWLYFKLPMDGHEVSCKVGAEVAWTRNGAMGLIFREREPGLTTVLNNLLSAPGRRVLRKRFLGQ